MTGLGYRAWYRSGRANCRAVRNCQMPGNHRRASDPATLANLRASRDSDTRRDHGVRANYAIVRDLNLVIELDAIFDDRIAHRAAVDRGVGTDLDIVSYRDRADLGNLDPASIERCEAKAVATDHCPAVNDATNADLAVVQHHCAWMNPCFVADHGARTDYGTGANPRSCTDDGTFADRCAGIDAGRRIHLCAIGHMRTRRDTGRDRRARPQDLRGISKPNVRLFAYSHRRQ